jgi:hypothetical protein
VRAGAGWLLLAGGLACGQMPLPAGRSYPKPGVVYVRGKLEVNADDSSLNQILREIANQTGMTIRGRLAEERVFGRYGPAAPVEILLRLLDGTGCNVLLVTTPAGVPRELIVTPRQGGATPPSPSQAVASRAEPPRQVQALSAALSRKTPGTALYGVGDGRGNTSEMRSDSGEGGSENGVRSPVPALPQSPNGVKTPQQIAEGLRELKLQGSTP